ncbi:MAG TPA: hypothetical protein EYO33_11910 [Phycisphaerales bacterium]|nr:hypothetical protein [Phycisphaerales bacterium]
MSDDNYKELKKSVDRNTEKIDELKDGQARLEGRFDNLEGRFDVLEGRFDGLETRADATEARADKFESYVLAEFAELKASVNFLSEKIDHNAKKHSQELARYFQMVLEQSRHEMKLFAEGINANSARLDNLEPRVDRLESAS